MEARMAFSKNIWKCCTIFLKFQESLNFYLFVISKIVKVTLIFRGKKPKNGLIKVLMSDLSLSSGKVKNRIQKGKTLV